MRDRGFTLLEVLASLALLSAAAVSIGHLIVTTTRDMHAARAQASTVALASARMEDLRSLTWGIDADGNRITDLSTNLSSDPPGSGGPGLSPSSPGTLEQNVTGYVDFLDANGRWLSAGPSVPPRAVFVRRWAVEVPSDGAADSLVLRVVVRLIVEDAARVRTRVIGGRAETRLMTLRTRVGR